MGRRENERTAGSQESIGSANFRMKSSKIHEKHLVLIGHTLEAI